MSHKTTLEYNFFSCNGRIFVIFPTLFHLWIIYMLCLFRARVRLKINTILAGVSKTSQIHFPQPRVLSWKSVSMQLKPPLGERLCCTHTLTEVYTWVNITHMLPLFKQHNFYVKNTYCVGYRSLHTIPWEKWKKNWTKQTQNGLTMWV